MTFSPLPAFLRLQSGDNLRLMLTSKLAVALAVAFGACLLSLGAVHHMRYRHAVQQLNDYRVTVERIQSITTQANATRFTALSYLVSPSPEAAAVLEQERERLRIMIEKAIRVGPASEASQDLSKLLSFLNIPEDMQPDKAMPKRAYVFFGIIEDIRKRHEDRLRAAEVTLTNLQRSGELLVAATFISILVLSLAYALNSQHRVRQDLRTRYLEHIAAEKRRSKLMARELEHRMKNLFSMIISIVNATARSETDVAVVARKSSDRINTLSQALALANRNQNLSPHDRKSVIDLIEDVAGVYCPPEGRMQVVGDGVSLKTAVITPLSLIFDELAANAMKYGAWSHAEGLIHVTVRACPETGQLKQIRWTEAGGPPPVMPSAEAEGFGTRMLNASVAQLMGQIDRQWTPGGLVVSITFQVEEARDTDPASD